MGAGFNNCDIDRAIQDDCFTLWVMTAAAIIDFSKKELWTNVETTFNMLTAHLCNNNTLLLVYLKLPMFVGPCHHGMARPQVVDGEMASDMESSCE